MALGRNSYSTSYFSGSVQALIGFTAHCSKPIVPVLRPPKLKTPVVSLILKGFFVYMTVPYQHCSYRVHCSSRLKKVWSAV